MLDWDRLWKFYKPPYSKQVPVTPGWVAAVYSEGYKLKIQAEANMKMLDEFDIVDGKHYWKGVELETLQEKGALYDLLEFTNGQKLNTVSQAVSQSINIINGAGIEAKEGSIARKLLDVLEAAVEEGNDLKDGGS